MEPNVMQSLVNTMVAMQKSLISLNERMERTEDAKKNFEAPKIDHKDIQKPEKFNGQKWDFWSEEFKGFLRRRDRRWVTLLEEVQSRSKAPLTEKDHDKIQEALKITDPEIFFAFQ